MGISVAACELACHDLILTPQAWLERAQRAEKIQQEHREMIDLLLLYHDPVLTISQVAELMHCHACTIRRHEKSGLFPMGQRSGGNHREWRLSVIVEWMLNESRKELMV